MHALKIHGLRKTYKNGVEALKGVDLAVPEGDFFALLGPNGAGKSTTIGIISSLVRKTAGTVEVFGHNIETELEQAKACIGVVPQDFNFNQFEPLVEIVAGQASYYGIDRKTAYLRAEKYLRQLGLWDKRHAIPRELSGGMKRRLMIARALVHEPRLLILDEPTAGVDIEIRRSMWAFLQEINRQGTTIILTTHYLEEAEHLCRHIAIINNGQTVESTEMKALLKTLHVETFILQLKQAVEQAPVVNGFTLRRLDDFNLEVDVTKDRTLNELFIGLQQQNVLVESLRNKANRLEELFMNMVEQGRA